MELKPWEANQTDEHFFSQYTEKELNKNLKKKRIQQDDDLLQQNIKCCDQNSINNDNLKQTETIQQKMNLNDLEEKLNYEMNSINFKKNEENRYQDNPKQSNQIKNKHHQKERCCDQNSTNDDNLKQTETIQKKMNLNDQEEKLNFEMNSINLKKNDQNKQSNQSKDKHFQNERRRHRFNSENLINNQDLYSSEFNLDNNQNFDKNYQNQRKRMESIDISSDRIQSDEILYNSFYNISGQKQDIIDIIKNSPQKNQNFIDKNKFIQRKSSNQSKQSSEPIIGYNQMDFVNRRINQDILTRINSNNINGNKDLLHQNSIEDLSKKQYLDFQQFLKQDSIQQNKINSMIQQIHKYSENSGFMEILQSEIKLRKYGDLETNKIKYLLDSQIQDQLQQQRNEKLIKILEIQRQNSEEIKNMVQNKLISLKNHPNNLNDENFFEKFTQKHIHNNNQTISEQVKIDHQQFFPRNFDTQRIKIQINHRCSSTNKIKSIIDSTKFSQLQAKRQNSMEIYSNQLKKISENAQAKQNSQTPNKSNSENIQRNYTPNQSNSENIQRNYTRNKSNSENIQRNFTPNQSNSENIQRNYTPNQSKSEKIQIRSRSFINSGKRTLNSDKTQLDLQIELQRYMEFFDTTRQNSQKQNQSQQKYQNQQQIIDQKFSINDINQESQYNAQNLQAASKSTRHIIFTQKSQNYNSKEFMALLPRNDRSIIAQVNKTKQFLQL